MQIGSSVAPLIRQAAGFCDHQHEIAQPSRRASHHLSSRIIISELDSFFNPGRLKTVSGDHTVKPKHAPRGSGTVDAPAVSVPDALCDALRNAGNWAGARFAGTTAIDSDPPDQLDCMDADDFEPEDDVRPSDYTSGSSGVAEASNNGHLRPSVPHTPWHRVVNARRRKVVAEEASATTPAPFYQRERRHGTGRPRLPAEDHKMFRIR
ncbi:hypothetical protein MTO96_006048 [Rhipicephalus appendiculatus]